MYQAPAPSLCHESYSQRALEERTLGLQSFPRSHGGPEFEVTKERHQRNGSHQRLLGMTAALWNCWPSPNLILPTNHIPVAMFGRKLS